MVVGIGVDIVDIGRIAAVCQRHPSRFPQHLLTESEWEHWSASGSRMETLAGIWAAKEAVSKALGTGFRGFGLRNVAIVHDQLGKPEILLTGGALQQAHCLSVQRVLVSISHSAEQAVAFAVAL